MKTLSKITLHKERMDKGGYINKGRTYFGIGKPLYRWEVDFSDGEWDAGYIRASSREEAKQELLKKFPDGKFFR